MKYIFLFSLFAVLVLSLTAVGQTPVNKSSISGIKSEVAIRRDARGVPYIEAKTDEDLYFAQGYVTASDRLWQMDLLRRVARGETSEIFGKAGLNGDKRWRQFNFSAIAQESIKFLSPDLRSALESYSRGVNAYIASLDEKTLPIEFRILQYKPKQWQPSDTVIIGKILADALSTTWQNDITRASIQGLSKEKFADLTDNVTPYDVVLFGADVKRATAQLQPHKQVEASTELIAKTKEAELIRQNSLAGIGLYAEDLAASNNWVISGKRTADGKPILANDPHLAPAAPGIWYLAHLSSQDMRVSGVTFPGVPGIILGHNQFIAWGATNVGPDVQDVYLEKFNDKNEYRSPTGWKKATVRKEVINVRANPLKPETEPVTFEVTETDNGPIILDEGGKKYALKWTAFDPHNNDFEAFHLWNRAKNWGEFTSAMRSYGGAAQNFVYADVKGNIGWYAASKIPIRRVGDGSLPYDGSTNDGDWIGFIPFEELPHLYNPPNGLIVTANQRTVGTSYKYTQFARDTAAPWRARRITDALNSRSKITMDDVRDAQHDVYNIPVANLSKEIVKRSAASPETLAVLKAWDGRMTADSRAALLASDIRVCIGNKMADANPPVPGYLIRERITDWAVREESPRWLPPAYKDYTTLLRSCDTAVRAGFADPKRFGTDESTWTWGRVWTAHFPHPLAGVPLIGSQFSIPSVPLDGSGQTPNVGSNVSMRHIASPGNWDSTRHVIPLGESGDPRSAYFKDQFDAWKSGAPEIFPFSKEAVNQATKTVTTLVPK